ncbi:hypothetical protein XSR1_30009 [Xenorhabdus szentirmaii DSM 16338]|uniref:Uncharacterized protein n=1 Tax=Xenorhabdus szentirmaii DSM 16338 TaxID=1427518 RepID=W1IZ87_9GAMM|nr:hypothetical protein XSR1_30009 [Xenorhabdus szentirmaii DSM 16338]
MNSQLLTDCQIYLCLTTGYRQVKSQLRQINHSVPTIIMDSTRPFQPEFFVARTPHWYRVRTS